MTFLDTLRRWFGGTHQASSIPNTALLNDLLERARTAHYRDNHSESLALLEQASEIAEAESDIRARVDIALSRADVLIAQGDLDTAEWVLNELRQESEERGMNAPLSYALSSLGVVAIARERWDIARETIEKAREHAEKIKTDGAAGRAMGHLAEVYWHEGNANYAVYLLEEAIPRLNNSGDRELLGHFYLILGRAQIASGQAAEGMVSLQQGLMQAQALKHQRQIRALSIELGNQALAHGQFQQAQRYFQEALRGFPEPKPQTAEMAHLLSQMSRAATGMHDDPVAVEHARSALTIAETLQDRALLREARAALGLALHQRGETEAALATLQTVAGDFENDDSSPLRIDVLRHLATLIEAGGDPQQAEETLLMAIEWADNLHFEQGQALSDLGLLYARQNRLREAIPRWQQAADLYQSSGHPEQIARTQCDIAAAYDALGDGRMAQREYSHALEALSRVNDEPTRGIILANIAAAYSEYGDLETAEDFFKEAIAIAERSRNAPAEARRRANYGRLLTLNGRYQTAGNMLDEAMRVASTNELSLEMAVIQANIGFNYSWMASPQMAINKLDTALEQLQSLESSEATIWQATVHLYLAWQHHRSPDGATQAKAHYEQTLSLAEAAQHIPVILDAKIGLTELAIDADKLSEAQTLLNEVDPLARRLQYKRVLARLHGARSRYLALTNDPENARSVWEEAEKLRSMMMMPIPEADWL